MPRRNTTLAVIDDENNNELNRTLRSFGVLAETDYRAWCTANGFARTLRHHPKVPPRLRQYCEDAASRRLAAERRRAREGLVDPMTAVCEQKVPAHDLKQRHLVLLHRAIEPKQRPWHERHIDRQTLARTLAHLRDCRAKFFDGRDVFASLGNIEGNSYVEALVAVVANESSWIRPVESWRPRSHNARRQFASLLRHLFVEFGMPEFFDAAWFEGPSESAASHRAWYIRVGRGDNIRTCNLPIPYTKRMAHYFLTAPASATIVQALRWGQVRALDGDARLAKALIATRLGESFDHDDFWVTVVRWFASHPMFDPAMIGPVIDYLHYQRFVPQGAFGEGRRLVDLPPAQPNLSMKGRSPESLVAQVYAWHRRLANDNSQQAREWRPSGIAPFEFVEGSREKGTIKVWTIRELLGTRALVAEGRKMRHCVASYSASCARGACSIWTVECETADGRTKCLTVEVRNAARRIVQVRGFANRRPTQRETEILHRWAGVALLSVGGYL